MTSTDWIGSIGVAILLLAFILHLANWIARNSIAYIVMNLVGAGLACLASVLLKYIPFIILEGAWAASSLISLLLVFRNPK